MILKADNSGLALRARSRASRALSCIALTPLIRLFCRLQKRFGHVECMFDKVNDIFQGFGRLMSLRLQKDGRAKSKEIWTNLSHWNTDGLSSRCEDLLFFQSGSERSAFET